jgi:hypothetical protein
VPRALKVQQDPLELKALKDLQVVLVPKALKVQQDLKVHKVL